MLPSLNQLSLENIAAPSGASKPAGRPPAPKGPIQKPKGRLNLDELINKTKEVVKRAAKAQPANYDQDGPQPLTEDLRPDKRDNTGQFLCPMLSCNNFVRPDGSIRSTVSIDRDGQAVCDNCGYVLGVNISQDSSARKLADENFQERQAKEHAGATSEEETRFNTITLDEGGWVIKNPTTLRDEKHVNEEALRLANVRFRQVREWVKYFSEENLRSPQLQFWLLPAEILMIKRLTRIACKQWAREGGGGTNNGSAIIWTIILVREMVARRSDRFVVINHWVRHFLTMDEMHDYLYKFKGDNVQETTNAASTRAGRQQRTLSGYTAEDLSRRQMAFYELGDINEQRKKAQRLKDLILRGSGMDQDLKLDVVTMQDFNVMEQPTRGR